MSVDEHVYDVLIVGGGPAGMAAASTASNAGLSTVLIDERPALGGQVYKQPGPGMVMRHAGLGFDYQSLGQGPTPEAYQRLNEAREVLVKNAVELCGNGGLREELSRNIGQMALKKSKNL